MNLSDIYPAVLTIVMMGMLLGIGLVILGTLQTTSSVTALGGSNITGSPAYVINQTVVALGTFGTWMGIIVLVIAAAVVIGLVVNSFKGQQG